MVACLLSGMADAQEPTRWRGDQLNGSYPDQGLLKEWPAGGPTILWNYDGLGKGYSAPVIHGDRIYMTGTPDKEGFVFILNLEGKLITRYPYGPEFLDSYPGSRCAPVVVADRIYVPSTLGVIYCLSADNGKQIWKKDLLNDFDGVQIQWGYTENLLVDGDVVYCTPGGKKYNVVALNRMTGDVVWSSPGLGEASAYCSPLVVELPTRRLLVTHTASHILGMDATTGKLLWSHAQPNQYSVHANTPLYHDGGLFCFSGYGQGGVKLKLNEDGSAVTKQWVTKSYDSRMGGAVFLNGYIYGSGDKNRTWQCLDWNTGEQKWVSGDLTIGVVIMADGMLFGYSQRGELALMKANPASFELKGKTQVTLGTDQHWAHPVLHDGVLYVRHGNSLIAYKAK